MKNILKTTALAGVSWLCLTAAAYAQDKEPVIDIQSISCRDMLKMEHSEQDFTLVYLHGFINGTKNEMTFDGPALKAATEKIFDHCIDNPSDNLLKVFQENR
jgi:hypothetical protein